MEKKGTFFTVIISVVFLGGLYGCGVWNSLGDDNVLEEMAEDALKDATGIDIDFTGDSPERSNRL